MNTIPNSITHLSREALMALVETLQVAALYIEGEQICLNGAAERLTGYGRDEIASLDDWFSKLHGPDQDKVREYFEEDRAAGFPSPRRVTITTKDGSLRHVEFTAAGSDRTLCLMHDITDLMVAQEYLKKNAEQLQVIMNTAMDGFWFVDRDGRIVAVNDLVCRMLGYSRDELLTQTIQTIDAVENPDETGEHIRKIMETGYGRFETRHRRKDGSIIDVEVSTSYQATEDSFLAFIRDITEQKRTQEALRTSEERFRLAMDATTDGLWDWDPATDAGYFSPAYYRMLGYEPNEFPMEFQAWSDLVHPEDRSQALAANIDCLEGKTPSFQVEFRMRAKDGGWRWILGRGMAVARDASGRATRMVGTHLDITERKEAEEALRQLNEELDRRVAERTAQLEAAIREQESFSYSVSHDLRAPLRHINSFSAMIAEDLGEQLPPEACRYLERIRTASARMGQLIDDLLELSRVGRAELHHQKVNLSRKAARITAMLRETELDRTVAWVIADGLTARGDATLLRQLLENLLGNAWKYTTREPQARIEFGKTVVEGEEAFFVRDNGVGFDMAYKHKLFGPFQRLHGSEFPGTGIGLATVQRIIERHGGKVWAESSLNEGATFYFTLPGDEDSTVAPA